MVIEVLRIKDSEEITTKIINNFWLVIYDRFEEYGWEFAIGDTEENVEAKIRTDWFLYSKSTIIPPFEVFQLGKETKGIDKKAIKKIAEGLRKDLRILKVN